MHTKNFIGRPNDFAFLVGDWHIDNRRLRQRHVGCDEWDEFPAALHALVMLDGAVSIDETRFPDRGFSGMTVRSLDRQSNQWAIYWINSQDGRLFPAVHGGFDGDRGEFYGEDTDDGRVVQVRFIWTRQSAQAARWEQAFSIEGGAWETNWTMQMRKLAGAL
jgi:hypothetical protein